MFVVLVFLLASYISVQAAMPGRPLWKNFTSKYFPNRGFSSTCITVGGGKHVLFRNPDDTHAREEVKGQGS
ncbi:hypothetical protein AC579_5183 [Pseudocercospora musae]|uniref:Secreted protein n=1 Tax=Pseudocercospora musae TaxID=113226 RepID=A0A139GUV8_9PEZI|nr:hypothetical protein AC579_5183 [Pseudocercospora musae]